MIIVANIPTLVITHRSQVGRLPDMDLWEQPYLTSTLPVLASWLA